MAFRSLADGMSSRLSMDAYPNHRQNASVHLNCNGSDHKQAVFNLTLYKDVLMRKRMELFYLAPCELLDLLPSLHHEMANRNFSSFTAGLTFLNVMNVNV